MFNASRRRRNRAPTGQAKLSSSNDPAIAMLHRLWVRLAIRQLKRKEKESVIRST